MSDIDSSLEITGKNNFTAALLVIAGMAMISTNDAIIKVISEQFGVGQLLFVRGSFAVLLFVTYIKLSGMPIVPNGGYSKRISLRALLECMATLCFVSSLTMLPIAIASTLVWTSPLLLTLAAAFVLGEDVTATRWFAVIVGFFGVVLVTNPFGEEFSMTMFLPLMAAIFVCARDLVTKHITASLPSVYVVLATLLAVTIAGLVISLFEWRSMPGSRAAWLLLSAMLLGGGFLCQVIAIRKAELSFVAPFSYTGILVATFYGYVIWQQLPSTMAIAGILLIVGSGIYILSSSNGVDKR